MVLVHRVDIPIQLTCAMRANASLDPECAMLINVLHSMHLDFLFVRTSSLASSLTTSVELI